MELVSETRDCLRHNCEGRMLRHKECESQQVKKFFKCDYCQTTFKVLSAYGYHDKGKWAPPRGMEFNHVILDETGV